MRSRRPLRARRSRLGTANAADAARTLVEQQLRSAGWTMTADAHNSATFVDEGGSSLEVGGRTFGVDDLRPLIFAPPGDVDGPIVPIDWVSGATDRTGKGCAATDYGDLPAHAIVLVLRYSSRVVTSWWTSSLARLCCRPCVSVRRAGPSEGPTKSVRYTHTCSYVEQYSERVTSRQGFDANFLSDERSSGMSR